MGVIEGPNNITSGLVLYLDAANPQSFPGESTINVLINPLFSPTPTSSGWSLTQYPYGSYGPLDGVSLYSTNVMQILHQSGYSNSQTFVVEAIYGLITGLTYTYSVWCLSNTAQALTDFYDNGTWIQTYHPGDSKWHLISTTWTCGSAVISFRMGIYSSANGLAYFTQPQVEQKSYATPFVNGTRGTTVATGGGWVDLSGNANNGALMNGILYSSVDNGSVIFDGVNDYIEIADNSTINFGTTNFSYTFWIKSTQSAAYAGLIGKVGSTGGYDINMQANGSINVEFRAGSVTITFSKNSTGIVNDGMWHFVCCCFDRSGNYTVYIDTVNVLTYDMTGAVGSVTCTGSTLRIGGSVPGSLTNFTGKMAQINAYNKSLSLIEIQQNYSAFDGRFIPKLVTSGMTLYLDASQLLSYSGSGTIWYDLSPSNSVANMRNLTSANWVSSPSAYGKSFETNHSSNQGFSVPSYNFPVSGRTYEIWIYFKTLSVGWQSWFDDNNTERILFGSLTNTMDLYPAISYSAGLVINTWYQLAYTLVGGTNTTAILYKNGKSVYTNTYTAIPVSGVGSLYILGDGQTETTSAFSSIVRVYNRVLTPDEINQNYNFDKLKFGLI